jgi:nicotinate-nucleotide adenylyltransferase
MHIGLFFGSFNPVHIGHMVLANYMVSFTDMQEVWFVVSPQNPLKTKNQLLNQNHRLHMVDLAIDDHPRMRSSNIEFSLSQPSYTINTLVHLKDQFPQHDFSLIMGQDNLCSFHRWKNHEEILKGYHIYVYPRPDCDTTQFDSHPHVHMTEAPVIDISSTFIRNSISAGKDVRFYLPGKVWEEVDAMGFYREREKK